MSNRLDDTTPEERAAVADYFRSLPPGALAGAVGDILTAPGLPAEVRLVGAGVTGVLKLLSPFAPILREHVIAHVEDRRDGKGEGG